MKFFKNSLAKFFLFLLVLISVSTLISINTAKAENFTVPRCSWANYMHGTVTLNKSVYAPNEAIIATGYINSNPMWPDCLSGSITAHNYINNNPGPEENVVNAIYDMYDSFVFYAPNFEGSNLKIVFTEFTGSGQSNITEIPYTVSSSISAVPSLNNPDATSITPTSATLEANILSAGNPATITARGFCYSIYPSTPVSIGGTGSICENAPGTLVSPYTGNFTDSITGLTPNTTYYFSGYATNPTGTGYSYPTGTFTTPANQPTTISLIKNTSNSKNLVARNNTEAKGTAHLIANISNLPEGQSCKLKNISDLGTDTYDEYSLPDIGDDINLQPSSLIGNLNNFQIKCGTNPNEEPYTYSSQIQTVLGQSGTLTTPDGSSCIIQSGASSCQIPITWTTTNPKDTSNTFVFPNGATGTNGNSGTRQYMTFSGVGLIPTGDAAGTGTLISKNKVDKELNQTGGIDNELASTSITLICVTGTTWDGTKCSPPQIEMSGTMTANPTSCVIQANNSTCSTNLSWAANHIEAIPTQITAENMTSINLNQSNWVVGGIYSGVKPATVPHDGRTFYLYNNSISLVPGGVSVSATCIAGTEWNNSICAPISSPTVNTLSAEAIGSTSATLKGNVTSGGSSGLTGKGFCYSNTITNPGLGDNGDGATCVSVAGTNTGEYLKNISSGLTAGTLYNYRAYATNEAGTAYGDNVQFTTLGTMGDINATECSIPLNQGSCNTTISWSTQNPTGTSTVQSPVGTTLYNGNADSKTRSISYGTTNYYLLHDGELLDSDSATASCSAGNWNMLSGKCENILTTLGTISATSCIIAKGSNSCQSEITWGTDPSTSGATVQEPEGEIIFTGASSGSTKKYHPITYWNSSNNYTTFYLHIGGRNSNVLAQTTAQATCASGSSWNGSECVGKRVGLIQATDCEIQAGGNACDTSLSFGIYNPRGPSNVTKPVNQEIYEHLGTQDFCLGFSWSGCLQALQHNIGYGETRFFLNDDRDTISETRAKATCVAGTTWNPIAEECQLNNFNLSGVLTATDCQILENADSCTTKLEWSVLNPIAGARTGVTTPPSPEPIEGSSDILAGSTTHLVEWGGRDFYLYHNNIELYHVKPSATCTPGTEWKTNKCVAITGKAELTSSVPIPRTVALKTPTEFSFMVKNSGTAPTSKAFANLFQTATGLNGESPVVLKTYFINTVKAETGEPEGLEDWLADDKITSLAVGESKYAKVTITFENEIPYFVRGCADKNSRDDVDGEIDEENELDNCSNWESVKVVPSIDGGWSYCGPEDWSECSESCDQTCTRTCTNPAPQGEGAKECDPPADITQSCNIQECGGGGGGGSLTVDLSTNKPVIFKGRSSNLDWEATGTGVVTCTGTGEGSNTFNTGGASSGSVTVSPTTTTTYTITCTEEGSSAQVQDTQKIMVINPKIFEN